MVESKERERPAGVSTCIKVFIKTSSSIKVLIKLSTCIKVINMYIKVIKVICVLTAGS